MYGIVALCYSHKYKKYVAIKKCRDILDSSSLSCDRSDLEKIYKELEILYFLKKNPSPYIVKMYEVFIDKNDVYIVFEEMKFNMRHYLKKRRCLYPTINKKIIWSCFKGLEHLSKIGIVHRDLKPSNILLNFDNPMDPVVKICDFGLSTCVSKDYVDYQDYKIVSLFYRPIELLFGSHKRSHVSVDIWSMGCIMYELLTKNGYLFRGEEESELIKLIFSRVTKEVTFEIKKIDPKYCEFLKKKLLAKFCRVCKKRLEIKDSKFIHVKKDSIKINLYMWKNTDFKFDYTLCDHCMFTKEFNVGGKTPPLLKLKKQKLEFDGRDLIQKCICLEKEKRITAFEALSHYFFTKRIFIIDNGIKNSVTKEFNDWRKRRRRSSSKIIGGEKFKSNYNADWTIFEIKKNLLKLVRIY